MGKMQECYRSGEKIEYPEQMFSEGFSRQQEEECCRLIARLARGEILSRDEWLLLLSVRTGKTAGLLFRTARRVREHFYGKRVFLRGAAELGSFSQNGGLQEEYLMKQAVASACRDGKQAGLRSFVLQKSQEKSREKEQEGGLLADLIKQIKAACPDCAVTLAAGIYPEETVHMWRQAGADRYLVRLERSEAAGRAGDSSRKALEQEKSGRKRYLNFLKKTGWQTGGEISAASFAGFPERLAEELMFLCALQPDIVEINPFLFGDSVQTAEAREDALKMTLYLMGIARLLLPRVLLPVSEILEKSLPDGRRLGLLCGANVLMMDLLTGSGGSGPYMGCSTAQEKAKLRRLVEAIGYEMVAERGDCYGFSRSGCSEKA